LATIAAACGAKAQLSSPTTPSTSTTPVTPVPVAPKLESVAVLQTLAAPGYPGIKSTQTLRVKATNDAGAAMAAVTVRVTGDDRAGWFYPEETTTGSDGTAAFVWVPGSPGAGVATVTAVHSGVTKTATTPTSSINPPSMPLSALNLFLNNSGNATGYSIDITPVTDPQGTYYAAMVWNGGYTGLQRDGSLYHDQLQFSSWDATGAPARVITRGAGLSCVTFGGEGTGQACSMNYPWSVGRTYRFEMEAVAVSGGREITLYVTDVGAGARTFVGTLFSGTTTDFRYLNTFVEQFHRIAPNCLEQPLREYVFTRAMARLNGAWQSFTSAVVAKQEEPTSICSNVDSFRAADGVHVRIGQRTAANPQTPVTISLQ
jgi:hypothetical protein